MGGGDVWGLVWVLRVLFGRGLLLVGPSGTLVAGSFVWEAELWAFFWWDA